MTSYSTLNIILFNLYFSKPKSGIKNSTKVTLNL